MKAPLLILSLFFLALSPTRAELRSIGVRVTQAPESAARVTIESDEPREARAGLTITEAATLLRQAQGWGSTVIVGIEAHGVPLREYLPLLQAIAENPRLELAYAEGRKPDLISENIRKRMAAAPRE